MALPSVMPPGGNHPAGEPSGCRLGPGKGGPSVVVDGTPLAWKDRRTGHSRKMTSGFIRSTDLICSSSKWWSYMSCKMQSFKLSCPWEQSLQQWLNSWDEVRLLKFPGPWTLVSVAQSCLSPCDPVDCSPPGSSVHGILQARVLGWVAISFFRGSSQPRDRTWVSCNAGRFFTIWATRQMFSL